MVLMTWFFEMFLCSSGFFIKDLYQVFSTFVWLVHLRKELNFLLGYALQRKCQTSIEYLLHNFVFHLTNLGPGHL